ncbi:TPA: hypothetical protein ACGOXV_000524 [Streptococcus suis]|uniref:hypothetical protein n=1 Tax=Streptococcus suis TaxID=1307 RepID=UPI0015572EC1|nr:hypothetical protein [Streptococcus suis]MBY4984884.1 hypothetical protein [Streptococcus suis]MBY5038012.1 hypothetical protein [Streptococcus suis]MDW8758245.1 hypothetical protein [Streptococcus suis]NQK45861.1 hypothetical protein [Streptococcus suis]
MRAKYIGKTESHTLDNGKIYEILSIEHGWYRVVDKSGEDYLYPAEEFEIIK